jgi:hypothetical protein
MLLHKAHASAKRPAWCIEHIMKVLHSEFDSTKLTAARDVAMSYMARTAHTVKRLKNLPDEAWEKMGESARIHQRQKLREFELAAEAWRQGPYGAIWDGGKIKRQPTEKELGDFEMRQPVKATKPLDFKT